MNTLDRKSFIIGFIKGYKKSSLQRFEMQDGKKILKRVQLVNYEKIERLSELNAIHCLLYDREMNGENFTLGEILDALDKNTEEAQQITSDLKNAALWKRN